MQETLAACVEAVRGQHSSDAHHPVCSLQLAGQALRLLAPGSCHVHMSCQGARQCGQGWVLSAVLSGSLSPVSRVLYCVVHQQARVRFQKPASVLFAQSGCLPNWGVLTQGMCCHPPVLLLASSTFVLLSVAG